MVIRIDHAGVASTALLVLSQLTTFTFAAADNFASSQVLSSFSSLLNTPGAGPITSFCCGDDCPPGCCDINRVIPTDMAYIYPPPPSPSTTVQPTPVSLPCCTNGCADGACRLPKPNFSILPVTSRPPNPGQTYSVATIACGDDNDCSQGYAETTAAFDAQITPAAEIAMNENFFNAEGIRACIGCGVCSPCINADIVTWVSFQPAPTSTHQPRVVGINTTQQVTPNNTPTNAVNSIAAPRETFYLAPEIVAAINGANQDFVPLVIAKGSSASTDKTDTNLITLLATVELKLAENYISRRLLSHLGLLTSVTAYPDTLPPSTAILSTELLNTTISATIVLDLVAGDKDGQTQHRFSNVRFQVYGPAPPVNPAPGQPLGKIDLSDVIVGSKFLREAGGLTVYQGFRGEVARGIDCIWPGHKGTLDFADADLVGPGKKVFGHDEL